MSSSTAASQDSDRPQMSPGLATALAARPLEMARRVQLLQARIHDEDSLLDLMFRISSEAFRTIKDVTWAGVSAQFDGDPFTMAHTHQRALVVDELQYLTGDGPCLQALHSKQRVLMSLADVTQRWPRLGEVAEKTGVQTFLAVPAPAFEVMPAAALNLYSDEADAFSPADEYSLTVLTEYLARGVSEYLLHAGAHGSTIRLMAAIEQRRIVNVAVGIVMAMHLPLNSFQARDVIYRMAGDAEQTVVRAAQEIINAQTQP